MNEPELVRMFKALAHPNRLRLFEEIRRGDGTFADRGACAGVGGCLLQHVIDVLNVGAPTVSHHLRELVNAGLVHTERVGKQLHCSVVPESLRALTAFFGDAPQTSETIHESAKSPADDSASTHPQRGAAAPTGAPT